MANENEIDTLKAMLANMEARLATMQGKAPVTERPPTPGPARLVWVWQDNVKQWCVGAATYLYPADHFGPDTDRSAAALNAQHAGYIDAIVFPRGELPRVVSSIQPSDYSWASPDYQL